MTKDRALTFNSLEELRAWWETRSRDEEGTEDGGADVPLTDADLDDGEDDPDSLCPFGGEHDEVTIQPATSRVPLARFCRKCRADLMDPSP
jgi:hypothetical protein